MSTSESRQFTLKSSDGEVFVVDEAVAIQSETIKNMIEDDCAHSAIPLHNVTGHTLSKVIEYCKNHVVPTNDAPTDNADEVKAFDEEFVKVDHPTLLFDVILAANYLNIKSLLDVTCQAVADSIKDKSPEEVRKIFNITNDFTPEEEQAIRKENAWAFD